MKKMIKRPLKLGCMILLCSLLALYNQRITPTENSSQADIAAAEQTTFTEEPSTAQNIILTASLTEETVNILQKTAGISGYVKTGTINLSTAKSVFNTIDNQTADYIIGSVAASGYGPNRHPKLFIHRTGWVVAYYERDVPTSAIINMKTYSIGNVRNILEEVISSVLGSLQFSTSLTVQYYHFKYPNADKLMIIVDRDDFNITIPGQLMVYETSGYWGGASNDYDWNYFHIDQTKLSTDTTHIVSLHQSGDYRYYRIDGSDQIGYRYNGGINKIALAVLYK
jgi:hypothetical protein